MTGRWPIIRCGRCRRQRRTLEWRCRGTAGELMQSDDDTDSGAQPFPAESGEVAGAARFVRGEARRAFREGRPQPELVPYAWVLALVAIVFLAEGIVARPSDAVLVVLTALIAATTVLALHIAHVRHWVLVGGTVIGAALVLTTLIQAVTGGVDGATVAIANAFLVALAPAAILIGVIRRMAATRAVTVEAVIGVLSVYLLLGMLFAFVYAAIDRIGASPFFVENVEATVSQCQYFSFTTLATVGYGDLTARSNLGHTLANFEAILGQVYLVTVVALIVGNLGRRKRD
jgi:hypothetical protein